MSERPDCHACRFFVAVANDVGECRHPAASLLRGITFTTEATSAAEGVPDQPIPASYQHEFQDSPGGPALTIEFAMHGIRHGWATWPMRFSPTWLRACTGWQAIPAPETVDES